MPRRGRPTLVRGRGRGRPTGPRPAADRGREPHAGRRGGAARAVPDGRTGAPRRDHRAARVGQVDPRRRAHRRGPRGRADGGGHRGGSVESDHRWRAARRPGADAGLRRRSRRVHPLDGVARARRRAGLDLDGGRRRPRRRRVRPRSSSRRSGPGRARSRSRPPPTRRSSSRRPRWATRSRRSRPACSRWPTSSWSTRATSRAPSGRRPSCARCWSPSAPRGTSAGDGRPARPRPKRPEVLITTAATGDGVPELLAALDRHRAAGRVGASAAARLARAEAQVWAIVADRLRARLGDAGARSHDGGRPGRGRGASPRSVRGGRPAARALGTETLIREPAGGHGDARHPARYHPFHARHDRAGVRRGRGTHGSRHRPGPRRDRAAGHAVRAGPGPRRGRPRADRGQPGSVGRQGPPDRRRARRDARPDRGHRRHRRVAGADLVIEAVFEDIAVKTALWRELDELAPAHADLRLEHLVDRHPPAGRGGRRSSVASGSSGCTSSAPCRSCRSSSSSAAATRATRRSTPSATLAASLGKQVIVSTDRPGFIVNRILMPFLAEAMRAFEEGIGSAEDIDAGARVGLNHPMGPLELADFIGLDVCLGIMRVLDDGLGGDRFRPPRSPDRARRGRQSRPEDRPGLLHLPAAGARGGRTVTGGLTEEERLLQATARDFATRELAPGADRARRGRAIRPLAVHEDGRARAHRGAAPRIGRRGRLLVPRLDARDGGARRGRHGDRGLAVGPHPVAVPGRDLGHPRAARALAAGDAQPARRSARSP